LPLSVTELAQALLAVLDRPAASGPQQVVTAHLVREELAAPVSGLQAAAGHTRAGSP
jgi:hypothetical protein